MSGPASETEMSIIFDGATVTTLGQIFGLDHKDVNKRLHGHAQPITSKDKYVRYRIRDAAPFLCEMKLDPEEMIKKLSPSKLPPALQDAFWKAQIGRQKWEENKGDLWRTIRVFEAISQAFKVIRLTILMFVDTVGERTELTEEQRRIIQQLGDGLLQNLVSSLRESFAFYEPQPDEHGMPLNEQVLHGDTQPLEEEAVEEVDPFA